MHVALLAPIAWRTPPRHYGPWERVVALLAEGLVDLGVEVTLFATADSHVEGARLEAVVPAPYEEDPDVDAQVWIGLHVSNCLRQAGRFDLVHSHLDFFPLPFSPFAEAPLLTTIHGFSSERILPAYRAFDDATYYAAISDADRHPALHYAATVYHGIDLPAFTFREAPGDYLLFFGRFHPDKGPDAAIRVAREAGMPLVMAGVVQDRAYFEREVEPHLDGERVRYVG
ncbi:MAG: glycosyltransferase, partial [Rhodothermales bacterium]|nr:glycosyltransferase [Rhodothermales bacterium]